MRNSVRLAVILGLAVLLAWESGIPAQQSLQVQVREGQLRQTASYLGKVVAPVRYGQPVTVLQRQGEWARVAVDGQQGWIHQSALTEKKISMQAGQNPAATTATSAEVAVAGKGFNKQVEEKYRAAHPQAGYAWIDRLESMRASPAEIQQFLIGGGLTAGGKAQ